ncbi:Arp2/3 complex subunit [Intoshia linei]|uniref:Arp2/3 complex 34 kDa subunit n=1 Tax=Intoshia linei TaxID=1819745 RepID=A0A177B6D3_9BILA|nr:Arp2/3 complex subunit [Intoshia linei]
MILIDTGNEAILDATLKKYKKYNEEKEVDSTNLIIPGNLNKKIVGFIKFVKLDFDGTVYHVFNTPNSKSSLTISLSLKYFAKLKKENLLDHFFSIYKEYETSTESGYDYTVCMDFAKISNSQIEKVQCDMMNIKKNCFASFFYKYFDSVGKSSLKPIIIDYRDSECLYISSSNDRVTVIFSTLFKDPDDIILSAIFMEEFKDERRKYQQAPQILFSQKEPPVELKSHGFTKTNDRFYITFILFERHMNKDFRENTINLLSTFREFIHYHIKMLKSKLNERTRMKASEFQKILDRAKNEKKNVIKKTIAGKTFRHLS